MVKWPKVNWGWTTIPSAGGAYALTVSVHGLSGRVASVQYCTNISNDAQGITGTFDLTGFSGEQFGSAARRAARCSRQTMDAKYLRRVVGHR